MGQQDAYRRPPPGYTGVRDGDTVIAHERVSSYHTVGLSVLGFALCCAAAVSIHMYFPYSPMKLFPFTPPVLGVCGGVSALLSVFLFSTNSVRIGFACLSLRTTTTYTVLPWLNSDNEYPFSRLVVQECDEPGRSCLRFKGEVDVLVTLGFLRPAERENEESDDVDRVTVGQITSRSTKWSKPLPLSDASSHGIEDDEEEVSAVELVAFWRGYTNFLRGLVHLPALTQHMDPDEEVSVSLPSSVAKPQALPLRRALEAVFGILPSDAEERVDVEHDETSGSEAKLVSKISYLWIAFACVISAIFFRVALHDGGVTALVLIPLGVFVVLSDRKDFSTFDISKCVASGEQEEDKGTVLGYSDWSCAALFRQSLPATRTYIDWARVVVESSGLSDFHGLPRDPRDDATPDFNADEKCPNWTARMVDPCDVNVTAPRRSTTRLRVVVLPAGQTFAARLSTPSSATSLSLGVKVARSFIHTAAASHSSTTGGDAANDGEIHTESTVVPIAWGVYPSEAARTARRFERMFTGLSLLSERS